MSQTLIDDDELNRLRDERDRLREALGAKIEAAKIIRELCERYEPYDCMPQEAMLQFLEALARIEEILK